MITSKFTIIFGFLFITVTETWAQNTVDELISSVFVNFTNKDNPDQSIPGPPPTPTPSVFQPTPSVFQPTPSTFEPTPSIFPPAPGPGLILPNNNNPSKVDPNSGVVIVGCELGYDCVPYFQCRNNTIVRDGEGLLDIRFDEVAPKKCPFLEECCPIEDKVTVPLITPKPTPEGCGYRNSDGIGWKITGDKDNETQYGEFPWMVAVLKEERGLNKIINIYQCGGSLIHPQIVLTAAHCVDQKPANIIKVRAGEWDTQTKSELYPDQDRSVQEVIIHENYHKGSLKNDIALLYLTEPFDLVDNVKPVCLPPQDAQFDYLKCFATGWGKDTFAQQGKYSVILKKIDLPIVPHDQCQSALRTTRLGKYYELHSSFICAGGELGKDTCKGDGGSPLVCPIKEYPNRYYQAGIVAWGIGCGDTIPGVYAAVAKFRNWIDDKLTRKGISGSFYTP